MNDATHPHLDIENTMTTIKTVRPGDQACWRCDGVDSVESSHMRQNASSVMYIPSVPLTLMNLCYIREQRESYLSRTPPPGFPGGECESKFRGTGGYQDVLTLEGRRAMGLDVSDLASAGSDIERDLLIEACVFPSCYAKYFADTDAYQERRIGVF